jgi:hypothetical protein
VFENVQLNLIIADYRDERKERLKICESACLYDFQIKILERKGTLFHTEVIIINIVVVVVVVVDSFEPEHNYMTKLNAHRKLMLSADIPIC